MQHVAVVKSGGVKLDTENFDRHKFDRESVLIEV